MVAGEGPRRGARECDHPRLTAEILERLSSVLGLEDHREVVELRRVPTTRIPSAAHNRPCGSPPFAVRVTTPGGKVVGYSGDTEWTDNLIEVADGADLFIAEAYFFDKAVKWHLSYRGLAENLSRLNAARVIATHMSADLLGRLDEVAIATAHDGLLVEI